MLLVALAGLGLQRVDPKEAARETVYIGDDRLISWMPLPTESGETCWIPASASATLTPALPQQSQSPGSDGAAAAPWKPGDAKKAEVALRKPLYTVSDPHFAFAGIAVDPTRNEVVIADENISRLLVYDRYENTPPTASMSEPKRIIGGENSFLEYACSVYVDPATGDIYGVNNDTMNWLPVFGRDQEGDVVPKRKIQTPHTTFGIVADEAEQELFLTIQDDHAVVVYNKEAKDEDSPVRILQGGKTLMADPHGIALDTKKGEIYVSNWGTNNERPPLSEGGGGDARHERKDFPVGRARAFPGSGKIQPPSITVYPKKAQGDTAPLRVIQGPKTQMDWPTALAFHPERNELFIANDTADSVIVFRGDANGDVAPIRVIKGPKTMVKNPTGVAIDLTTNELWVANFGNHSATVFAIDADGNATPKRVIRGGPTSAPAPKLANAHTTAYDSKREEILIANCVGHPQVAAFSRTANGGAQPTREIAGQNTLFTRTMHDMAYDWVADEIVVPQFFAFAILTFAGDANGNVPPKRKIFGPKTRLDNPHAVSVDPVHGELFVPGRADDHTVLVFPREANGDVAPIRVLETDREPARVALDPPRNLLIVSGGRSLRIYDRRASGKTPPLRVIDMPASMGQRSTGLMTVNPENGTVFVSVGGGGRFALEDFVGVWSVEDKGEVVPRWTIGGPNNSLKDIRGVAIDIKNKNVIVTDKELNAILTFHVPEAFEAQAR